MQSKLYASQTSSLPTIFLWAHRFSIRYGTACQEFSQEIVVFTRNRLPWGESAHRGLCRAYAACASCLCLKRFWRLRETASDTPERSMVSFVLSTWITSLSLWLLSVSDVPDSRTQ